MNESFRLNDFGYLVNFNFYNVDQRADRQTKNQLEMLNGRENQKKKNKINPRAVWKKAKQTNYSQTKRSDRNLKVVVLFCFDRWFSQSVSQ